MGMTEHVIAEYEAAWRRALASPNRRYWFGRLRTATPQYMAAWKYEVVERLRAEWAHRTPMERANERESNE